MRPRSLVFLTLPASLLLGCDTTRLVDASREPAGNGIATQSSQATGSPGQFATLITLPSLSGRTAEALAVNNAGTVIAGYAWERRGTMRAVKWTLQANGSWAINALPHATTATGAIATSVNRAGDVAGNDWPALTPHVVLWSATGGFSVLGCSDLGEAYGISADGQVVVGAQRPVQPIAAVWRPGSCREDLPSLVAGGLSRADAANADGTIVGGAATSSGTGLVPVRWVWVAGAWQIEQLDTRLGGVRGANAAGDLAGAVSIPCALYGGCQRAVIWHAAGGSRELGTLGGEHSWARGINAAGEVVGASVTAWAQHRVLLVGVAGHAPASYQGKRGQRKRGERRPVGRHPSRRRHGHSRTADRVGGPEPLGHHLMPCLRSRCRTPAGGSS